MTLIALRVRTWIALLFVFLFLQRAKCEGILGRRGLPTLTTTTASSQPSSYLSTSDSSYSNSTYSNTTTSSQSASVTFVPVIPSSDDNKYVYHTKHMSSTVFVAVGSCMAFIIAVVVVVWIMFGIGAWRSARKEYKLKEMEQKYQYDPFFYGNGMETGESSDSDEGSDISEKVLKNKSSRLSLYSLGSTSVLNLLNQAKSDAPEPNATTNNNRRSMFISPTELLQSEANNSTLWAGDSPVTTSLFDPQASTPSQQSYSQVIGCAAGPQAARPQVAQYTDSPAATQSNTKSNYRPPSIVLDQLLDEQNLQA